MCSPKVSRLAKGCIYTYPTSQRPLKEYSPGIVHYKSLHKDNGFFRKTIDSYGQRKTIEFYGRLGILGYLAGGFNPSEKYVSNWIFSPSRGENESIWNHHHAVIWFIWLIPSYSPPIFLKKTSKSLSSHSSVADMITDRSKKIPNAMPNFTMFTSPRASTQQKGGTKASNSTKSSSQK